MRRDDLDLLSVLPHRPPMRLVDRIVSLVPHKEALGQKDIADDDFWLAGHFPGNPVFPGVLIVEALAQTACVLALHSSGDVARQRLPYLLGVDNTRFRRIVRPGDTLDLHVRCAMSWGPFWRLEARASVGGELAAEARLLATLADADEHHTTAPAGAEDHR